MIDYYETKSQPITKVMVWQAYKEVRSKKGSGGIDKMSLADLERTKNKETLQAMESAYLWQLFP
jgi:RNA-directed DNA polymerase